ncbi:MAG TPA: hypothetical protein VMX16_03630 [Terriglobia bacterium]|nr:hypothetical protein [Terriglobia bacterium]
MKKILWIGFGALALGVLLAYLAATPVRALPAPAAGAPQGHPQIMAALRSLNSARYQLNGAATVYGGHRAKAEQLTDQAIRECHAAIDYARTKHVERIPPAPPMSKGQRKAERGYPAMHAALNDLTVASNHLQRAAKVFGGHRANALRFANQAINECHAALRYVHAK